MILFCTLPYDPILHPTLWSYFAPYPMILFCTLPYGSILHPTQSQVRSTIQHSQFKIVNGLKDPSVLFFGSRNTEEKHRRIILGQSELGQDNIERDMVSRKWGYHCHNT